MAKQGLPVRGKASTLILEFLALIQLCLKQPPGLQHVLTLNTSAAGSAFYLAGPTCPPVLGGGCFFIIIYLVFAIADIEFLEATSVF